MRYSIRIHVVRNNFSQLSDDATRRNLLSGVGLEPTTAQKIAASVPIPFGRLKLYITTSIRPIHRRAIVLDMFGCIFLIPPILQTRLFF